MKNGAFALIDCLGFKGLWKNGHEQLLSKLRLVKNSMLEGLQAFSKSPNHSLHFNPDYFTPEVRLLSDTVAISLTSSKNENDPFSDLLAIAAIIQAVIDLFLENEPQLLLRGCITHGKHHIEDNFLIGPAVDEAAEYMDSAQGAFVWFLPNAATIIESTLAFMEKDRDMIFSFLNAMCPSYQVPIKGGHYLDTRVINPIINKSPEVAGRLMEVCAKVMDVNKMDVWMKRQHTLEFLTYCKEQNAGIKGK